MRPRAGTSLSVMPCTHLSRDPGALAPEKNTKSVSMLRFAVYGSRGHNAFNSLCRIFWSITLQAAEQLRLINNLLTIEFCEIGEQQFVNIIPFQAIY